MPVYAFELNPNTPSTVTFCNIYCPYLSTRKPNAEPRIKVIRKMGTSENGSFHPIRMAAGDRTRNEMIIPLIELLIFMPDVAIKKPDITQRENAERLASQGSF